MTDSQKIKVKVKERYAKVSLTGDSCCGPLGSTEWRGGECCSTNVVLKPSLSPAQVSGLVGYNTDGAKVDTKT
ncbi:MAG: hypothetical protein WBX01_05910 [Nitrososphaeraceae archaeon]